MTEIMAYPEGATPLNPDEMQGLRLKHVSTREQLNEVEQANIETGLTWLNRQRRPDVLSEDFLCTLHKRLFGEVWEWAGAFRRTEKNIGVDPLQIAVQLRMLLGDAKFWLANGTYQPSEAAIRFHHKLVYIHLYPNGNGRHARIAADALLEKVLRVEAIDWSGGHDLQAINARRTEYITALRAADGHDFAPLIAFIGHREDLARPLRTS